MTTFIFAMTHPPELTALLEINPALWLAYVSKDKYRKKTLASAFKRDWLAVVHYSDCHNRAIWLIETMGYSATQIGKPRETK